MKYRDLTIVINTFRSSDKIFKCLNSINKKYKVIVIENSNDKNFKKILEKKYKNVKCFLTNQNLGYAKGNNFGLKLVKTKYSLILNPDTILDLHAINNFFLRISQINSFSIIAPAYESKRAINKKIFIEVEKVKGFAMFLNMRDILEIGLFDENFFIYLEEIDLCNRLRKKNKKIFLDSNIKIYHQGGSSHDKIYNFQMELSRNWHWMWSNFYYKKKNDNYFFALLYCLKKIFSSSIKFIIYLLLFNKNKKLIYKHRILGLFNAMIGRPSWFRPKI